MLFTGLIILAVHITLSSARQGNCNERGPICGNDGKTYLTMCQMIWARLEDADLAVLHEGSCNGKYQYSPKFQQGNDGTGPAGKVVKKIKTKDRRIDYGKLKKVMPVGWPPLGPVLFTNLQRSPTETENVHKPAEE